MILVIETATAACSVALIADGAVIAAAHDRVGRGHAEHLLPMVGVLLGGRRPDAIAVDCGPGSFTGVRVGLAAARALGFGWDVPVRGFSSLALIAAGARRGEEIAVAIAGGHGELFVQSFAGMPPHATSDRRSLLPIEAARTHGARRVRGSGAGALVEARGWGVAEDAEPVAADFPLLPPDAADLPALPIYGRAPDAKPGKIA